MSDLLQSGTAPAGTITCLDCGATLAAPAAAAHGECCPVAARWAAIATLGGDAPTLSRTLAREAYAAGGTAAVAAVASQLEAMAAALRAGASGAGAP